MQASIATYIRAQRILIGGLFALSCFASAPIAAQNMSATPLYGTVDLEGGFSPDPHVVVVQAGGSDSAAGLGGDCTGFINNQQPDYDLNYAASTYQLGIFVSGSVDTTLVVNDPNGDWHCNDDYSPAGDTNPGLIFLKPRSGNYNIWVGTYKSEGNNTRVKLVLSEREEDFWANMDLTNVITDSIVSNSVDFGDDSSQWANDDECDDPRFEGDGVSWTLLESDTMHDASDCRTLFNAGRIRLVGSAVTPAVDFGDDTSSWANDDECDDPRFEGDGMSGYLIDSDRYHDATDCRNLFIAGSITLIAQEETSTVAGYRIERGALEAGDTVLDSNEYADTYTFEGIAGQEAVVDLRSGEFDPYLMVKTPSGEQMENDDYEGDTDRSLLVFTVEETGTYRVIVTSYKSGESGGYTVEINTHDPDGITTALNENGSLRRDDTAMTSGEYYDTFEITGMPGQKLVVDLRSDDFDTYLILRARDGTQDSNDDSDSTGHSRIEKDLTQAGTYQILVTSYAAKETGQYRLTMTQNTISGGQNQPNRDVMPLIVGQSVSGSLTTNDQQPTDRGYRDIYVFDGTQGQTISINLSSTEFDTYLNLITPEGESIDNDDFEGSTNRSAIELTLRQTGRYRVVATSYASGETGNYALSLNTRADTIATRDLSSGGRIYGIFAGIADYPGEANDLSYTDEDAVRVRDALLAGAGMRPEDAITLLNSDATLANMREAIRTTSNKLTPADTLVIFYSGHGSRQVRQDGPDSFDPDGLDETIELYDGSMTDDELRILLEDVRAGITLLVLDSCFSGGFAKDIISVPGRMGLFSSEEDVTSQVAVKFRAGGYLSVFFDEAVRGRYADTDKDGVLTAVELSQYLHERFRNDVKSFNPNEYVRTSDQGYQHLVVDRGGVGPYDKIF